MCSPICAVSLKTPLKQAKTVTEVGELYGIFLDIEGSFETLAFDPIRMEVTSYKSNHW